jgi:hypothetical protein
MVCTARDLDAWLWAADAQQSALQDRDRPGKGVRIGESGQVADCFYGCAGGLVGLAARKYPPDMRRWRSAVASRQLIPIDRYDWLTAIVPGYAAAGVVRVRRNGPFQGPGRAPVRG